MAGFQPQIDNTDYVEDEIGRRFYTIRNAKSSVIRRYATAPGGSVIWSEGWERNADEFVTAYTNRLGNVTSYTLDANNRATGITHPDGSTEGMAYNTLGQLTHHTNQLAQVTSYHYDSTNRLSHVVDVAGYTNSFTYDHQDRIQTHTDGRGHTTTYAYDARGNQNLVTFADNSTQSYGFNDHGQLTSVTNEIGQVSYKTYNDYGQLAADTDRWGRTTAYDYNLASGGSGCCGLGGQNGQPVQIISPSGKITAFQYDLRGRRTAVINSYGTAGADTNRFEFDLVGRITNRIDAFGESWGSQYDLEDRLTNSVDALGQATSIEYVALNKELHRITTDPAGGIVTNITDTMNRLRHTTYPDGGTEIRTYDPVGRIDSITGTAVHGLRYEYGFDTYGVFTKEIRLFADDSDSGEWLLQYIDANDNPIRVEFPDGAYSSYSYDSRNRPIKLVDPDGVTKLHTYNSAGESAYAVVDVNTNGIIDLAGVDRVTFETNFAGSATLLPGNGNAVVKETYVWPTMDVDISVLASRSESSLDGLQSATSSFGLTNLIQNPLCSACGVTTNTAFDGSYTITEKESGRVLSVTRYDSQDNQLGSQSFTYDELGRRATMIDARTGTNTFTYDDVNLWSSLTTPAPGVGQSPQTTTTYTDSRGRAIRIAQPDGTSITNEYHLTGELKKTYGSRTYPVACTHDHAGRMTTLTTWKDYAGNSGQAVTTWNYSTNRGWLLQKKYDDGHGPEYTYHPSGKLKTRDWVRGITTTYGYNTAGDLSSIDYSDGTADIDYIYDRLGRQVSIDQGTNTTDRTYNHAGRLLTESYTGGALDGVTVTNTYDSLLRRSRLETIKPSAFSLTTLFDYDAASRLNSVGDGTNTATYAYLQNSPLVEQITFTHDGATNMTTTKSYDFLNRLTSISHVPASDATASFSYGYNAANQRTNVTHADDSYWSFGYDSLGQVISGKKRDDQDALIADHQFEYDFDDIGNRTAHRLDGTAGGVLQSTNSYAANLLNQYTNIAGATPVHDADGNLSSDTNWVYTWNGENRLVELESSTNVPAASRKKLKFTYDHHGRRTSKTVSTWNTGTSEWDLSYERHFLYDAWNLIAELDGSTNVVNSFAWGLDLSGSEQGAGGVGGFLMLTDHSNDGIHFVGHDGNGNVMRLVDSSLGTVTASYEYSPFGKRLSGTGTMATANPFRFSTKYEDDESGFNYYGYRFYNPDSGRWLNRDPRDEFGFGELQIASNTSAWFRRILNSFDSQNAYLFVHNQPIGYYDILGLDDDEDDSGDDSGENLACIAALEQLEAALAELAANPGLESAQRAAAAAAHANKVCFPDENPPNNPPTPPTNPPTNPPGQRPPGQRPPTNPPAHRPPGQRPPMTRPQPPAHRPPGVHPPGQRPPGQRPPARPPALRPPVRPPLVRPVVPVGAACGAAAVGGTAGWWGGSWISSLPYDPDSGMTLGQYIQSGWLIIFGSPNPNCCNN